MDIRPTLAQLLTALAALLFVAIGSVGIAAQGAYYDELHQATASFCWLSRDTGLFARGEVLGVPLFNMTYSGAIKSHLFGAWLWLSGEPFSLLGWRWFGLSMGAAGILALGTMLATCVPWRRLAVVLALLTTDATLLVACRNDWGPVAMAFLLRCLLLGLCLRPVGRRPLASALLCGFLLGVAIYEKLSSLVVVAPVLLLWSADPMRRSWRQWAAMMVGGAIGAAPVILWNLQWLLTVGKLASLGQTGEPAVHELATLGALLAEVAVMPQGGAVQQFVLGSAVPAWREWLEAGCLVVAVAAAVRGGAPRARWLALGGLLVCLGLWLLPSRTGVHHWVLATPWWYLAAAAGLVAGARVLQAVVAIWLLLRVVSLVALLSTLATGPAQTRWSPELHRLMAFAATTTANDVFVAGDWGVATQIACATQGRTGAVVESFRDGRLPALTAAQRVFLVGLQPASEVAPGAFEALATQLAAAGWRRDAEPTELQGLTAVQVQTFVRR